MKTVARRQDLFEVMQDRPRAGNEQHPRKNGRQGSRAVQTLRTDAVRGSRRVGRNRVAARGVELHAERIRLHAHELENGEVLLLPPELNRLISQKLERREREIREVFARLPDVLGGINLIAEIIEHGDSFYSFR